MAYAGKGRTWRDIEKPLFTLFIGLVLLFALRISLHWAVRASIIVLVLGSAGLALAAAQLVSDIKHLLAGAEGSKALTLEAPALETGTRWGNLEIWGWIFGFYFFIHLIGFPAAAPLFVFFYTKVYGGGWILSSTLAVSALGFLYSVFDAVLHVPWPEPLINILIQGG